MSLFKALNLEDEVGTGNNTVQEQEEHTRELQVEQGFRIYDTALNFYKDKEYQKAKATFEDLFQLEILKPNYFGYYLYNSSTLDKLRYLCYRNRGFLYYECLTENYQNMQSEDIVEDILKCITDLLEALQHGTPDYQCTELLVDLFQAFKSKKLQRWILETELTRDSLISNSRTLLPQWKKFITKEQQILKETKDEVFSVFLENLFLKNKTNNNINNTSTYKINENINPLLLKISEMKAQDDKMIKELSIYEIIVEESSWDSLFIGFKALTPNNKLPIMPTKVNDSYSEVDESIESVKILVKNKKQKTPELVKKEDSKSAVTNKEEYSVQNTNKRSAEERIVQRVSKRVRERNNSSEKENNVNRIFLSEFNKSLKALGFDGIEEDLFLSENVPSTSEMAVAIKDFYDCLSNWSNKYVDILKQSSPEYNTQNSNELEEIVCILGTSAFGDEVNNAPMNVLHDQLLDEFISEVNQCHPHFQQLRIKLLFTLLSKHGSVCLVTDTLWSADMYEYVEYSVVLLEEDLFDLIVDCDNKYCLFAVSIIEILVNLFCRMTKELLKNSYPDQKKNELEENLTFISNKIERWDNFLRQHTSISRYQWAMLYFCQAFDQANDIQMIKSLESIKKKLKAEEISANCNYRYIPSLTTVNIENEISKINILKKFRDPENLNRAEKLNSLLKILNTTGNKENLNSEEIVLYNFIEKCPFIFKLQIWDIIFHYLITKGNAKDAEHSYFKLLAEIFGNIKSDRYKAMSPSQRRTVLIVTLNNLGRFTKYYTQILLDAPLVVLELDTCCTNLLFLVEAFRFFYSIIHYEMMCLKDSSMHSFFKKAEKSSQILKELFANIAAILSYCYYQCCIYKHVSDLEPLVCEFFSNFHQLIYSFGFCDSGLFLQLNEKIIYTFHSEITFDYLHQVLYCRYHVHITNSEHSQIELHNTKKSVMSKKNALALARFIVRYQYGDLNPMFGPLNKASSKQSLDMILEVIGQPNYESNYIISRNNCYFKKYLESPITVDLLRAALNGKLDIGIIYAEDPYQDYIKSNVFFVFAVQQLNIYKIRKKSMQARPSELDTVIMHLKSDIIFDSGKFESWFLLAKCYNYIVDDDMTWTSDKLIVFEKKKSISKFQRYSILCYMMAISLCLQKMPNAIIGANKENLFLLCEMLEALGSSLTMGYLKPMEGLCFKRETMKALFMDEEGHVYVNGPSENQLISDYNIKKGIILSYEMANKTLLATPQMKGNLLWEIPYHFAKANFKFGAVFDEYKEQLLRSCRLSWDIKTQKNEHILEPHYFLIVCCYKLVKREEISIETALAYLSEDNFVFQKGDEFWKGNEDTKEVFYEKCIELLQVIIHLDKKKWYHRPKYKIAKILFEDLSQLDKALTQLEELVNAKNVNKNLVTIWKPDFERPGKHFVYTTEYIVFYIELLFCKNDIKGISQVLKKIKKFGSGMLNMNAVQEKASRLYCQCVQSTYQINDKEYVEQWLPTVNFKVFNVISQKVYEDFDIKIYDAQLLEVFLESVNLKKGTIIFDGICIGLYIKYFYGLVLVQNQELEDSILQASETQQSEGHGSIGNRKRVSKKDIFDRINPLVVKINDLLNKKGRIE
ncbi:Hir3p SCDLUD_004387 [Saccharomycodes ludwigii]|uniref:Hir3p n=1 Tax=Saccharomycodes ludwigii TaxID=36035 RepID=UPI001E84A8E8|nr:hypothetical protein SCDLUD_004387 [Saccharomycodes ludwigii]KAH3900068.1 hypothetical protein SCDLUD_004387 [Saccharomycodes ludwigii]